MDALKASAKSQCPLRVKCWYQVLVLDWPEQETRHLITALKCELKIGKSCICQSLSKTPCGRLNLYRYFTKLCMPLQPIVATSALDKDKIICTTPLQRSK
jgi:hypothetical protein